jgi:uncharacterized protein YecT (DUF1311 family)
MTTSRCEARIGISLLLLLVAAPISAQSPTKAADCSNIDPFMERKCVSARITQKEQQLADLVLRARSAVTGSFSRYGDFDNRTDPRFLDKSQFAWKSFVESNCTVVGAYGGGSNSAISDRITACYESELDHRAKFFTDLVEGTGDFGP